MKVTFEVDLEAEGGNDDFKSISKYREMAAFIYEFEQELRKLWKYGSDTDSVSAETVDRIWKLWHDTKREFEIADL